MRTERIDVFDEVREPELEVKADDKGIYLVVTGAGVSDTSIRARSYLLAPKQAAQVARELTSAAKGSGR